MLLGDSKATLNNTSDYLFCRQYRPLYKELSAWPELNLRNPPGVSPFADPKHTRPPANPKTSSTVRDDHKEKYVLQILSFVPDQILCSLWKS